MIEPSPITEELIESLRSYLDVLAPTWGAEPPSNNFVTLGELLDRAIDEQDPRDNRDLIAISYLYDLTLSISQARPQNWEMLLHVFNIMGQAGLGARESNISDVGIADRQRRLIDIGFHSTDASFALNLIYACPTPMEAVPCAVEEILWRSGYGVDGLKFVQHAILQRFSHARNALRNDSTGDAAYRILRRKLMCATDRLNYGPVTKAIVKIRALDELSYSSLTDRYAMAELQSLHILLIEMEEAGANLNALLYFDQVAAPFFARQAIAIARTNGPIAARRWLRENRNNHFNPPKYQFEIIDYALKEQPINYDKILGQYQLENPKQFRSFVTFKKKDGEVIDPEAPSEWELFLTNFAVSHEAFHAGLHSWPGHPDHSLAPTLSFRVATIGNQMHLSLNGWGKVVYDPPAARDDKNLASRVEALVESSIELRRSGNAKAAVDQLSNLADELDGLGASVTLALKTDNALAGAIRDTGDLAKAISLYRKCIDAAQRRLGTGSRLALVLEDNLAEALLMSGDISDALATRVWVAQASKLFFGDLDFDTLKAEYNLASTLLQAGDSNSAHQICSRLVTSTKGQFSARDYIATVDLLGSTMIHIGKADDAYRLRTGLYQQCAAQLGLRDPTTRIVRHNLYAAFSRAFRKSKNPLRKISQTIDLVTVLLLVPYRAMRKQSSPPCSLRNQAEGDY